MKVRKLGLIALAGAAVLSLAACGSSTPAPAAGGDGGPAAEETITLRVQSQPSIAAESMYIGIEKGFFEEEGLEIELVDIPDASAAIAATQAGSIDIAFVPTITALTVARQNIPIQMITPADGLNPKAATMPTDEARNYTSVGLYAGKDSGITDLKGLAGAKIAIPDLKSQPEATITSVLQEAGVDTSGIEWIALGFVPAITALAENQIDAAFLVSPFSLQADEAGHLRLSNPSVEFFPPGFATTSWSATTTWIQENPEAVARFQRAMQKASAWSNDNIDVMKEHVIERTGLQITAADMPNSYWPLSFDPAQLQEVDDKLVAIDFYPSSIDTSVLLAPGSH